MTPTLDFPILTPFLLKNRTLSQWSAGGTAKKKQTAPHWWRGVVWIWVAGKKAVCLAVGCAFSLGRPTLQSGLTAPRRCGRYRRQKREVMSCITPSTTR